MVSKCFEVLAPWKECFKFLHPAIGKWFQVSTLHGDVFQTPMLGECEDLLLSWENGFHASLATHRKGGSTEDLLPVESGFKILLFVQGEKTSRLQRDKLCIKMPLFQRASGFQGAPLSQGCQAPEGRSSSLKYPHVTAVQGRGPVGEHGVGLATSGAASPAPGEGGTWQAQSRREGTRGTD